MKTSYFGLLHILCLYCTPPPHDREHDVNSRDHCDQAPSTAIGLSSGMHLPRMHHCGRENMKKLA